ncbi:hypothetical protein DLAC_11524 [Tieghemostelium lacteum]|uniref:Sm protein F n=1 Tax=Tieghemostelium lacteum TaxID=361077 RepID=A0A152A2Q3_TIELA|nr:hypothetical protein DLAC_11524 [Tieghemostelium lacteum]|eukprot:KYR00518.1 hypothetical protein DLAC_11524 [Tieghemostelium lacteum]
MSRVDSLAPKPYLFGLKGQKISVKLKWGGMEYRGILASVDNYMNVLLAGTEEWIDGALMETLGEVLIRCNNVLYIRGIDSNEDTEMQTS